LSTHSPSSGRLAWQFWLAEGAQLSGSPRPMARSTDQRHAVSTERSVRIPLRLFHARPVFKTSKKNCFFLKQWLKICHCCCDCPNSPHPLTSSFVSCYNFKWYLKH
jgi:hypothetical protein